jgi:parvulin-like peptidyl-prolyl isomerase
MRGTRFGWMIALGCFSGAVSAVDAASPKSGVVATVDRQPITEADVDLQLLLHREGEGPAATREAVIEDLIDRHLIRNFVSKHGIKIPPDLVDMQWAKLQEAATARGQDLAAELKRIGYSEVALKEDLSLPLAWTAYVKKQTTPDQIRAHFEKHKNRFDGSTRHVRHLVLTVAAGADDAAWKAAEDRVRPIRESIASGKTAFEDAAKEHSDSPSAEKGGDLGFVHYRGDLPAPVAEAAFATELKMVSEPIRSPFGWHLVVAEEERPGDISLEDARSDVLEAIAKELWQETARGLRKKAKIVVSG